MTQHAHQNPQPAVRSMLCQGSLRGLVLDLRLQQTFRNESDEDLTLRTAFPIGPELASSMCADAYFSLGLVSRAQDAAEGRACGARNEELFAATTARSSSVGLLRWAVN